MRGFILVFALPALFSSPALSENWRESTSVGNVVGYIDTDAITRDGDKVRFWRELRWPEPQTAPTGHRFDRMGALVEVDCRVKTIRSFRNRLNLGDHVLYQGKASDDSAEAVGPGTAADVELRAVCFDDWASGN